MGSDAPGRLERVFARAARLRGDAEARRAEPSVRRARRILDARRDEVAAETCPVPVRRRVEGWLAGPSRARVSRWLRTLLDSRQGFIPATRGAAGAPRTLRYVGQGAVVDLQIRTSPSRGVVLHVAVNPVSPGATVEVRLPHRGPPRRAFLDGDGTVDLTLPAGVSRLNVTVRLVSAESVRVPTLHLT